MSISNNRREFLRLPRLGRLRHALPRLLALALIGGVALTTAADAAVRLAFPGESPGPPFYARAGGPWLGEPELAPHTDDWAAIAFYRSPACVPDDFNLLEFFDVPAAFSCALTVDGFEIWRNGPPPLDPAPMAIQFRGLGAVPVWFVSWEDLQAAAADDMLTLPELLAIPSLRMGSASFFREELHPTGGAQNGFLTIRAHGVTVDGQGFVLHTVRNTAGIRTSIEFFDN
jgi:hypothetical protein